MISPLAYLKQQLNFTVAEWQGLTEADKVTLRQWAADEQSALAGQ